MWLALRDDNPPRLPCRFSPDALCHLGTSASQNVSLQPIAVPTITSSGPRLPKAVRQARQGGWCPCGVCVRVGKWRDRKPCRSVDETMAWMGRYTMPLPGVTHTGHPPSLFVPLAEAFCCFSAFGL